MDNRINTKELARLLGLSINALRKRIRYGTIAKSGLECVKNEYGFYTWDREEAEKFAEKFNQQAAEPKLSDDIRVALSVVRRIKLDKWPYDTDNELFFNLRPEAKQLILDALNEQS